MEIKYSCNQCEPRGAIGEPVDEIRNAIDVDRMADPVGEIRTHMDEHTGSGVESTLIAYIKEPRHRTSPLEAAVIAISRLWSTSGVLPSGSVQSVPYPVVPPFGGG